jgi:hypothetical protein
MYTRLKGQPRRMIRTIKSIKNNIVAGKKSFHNPCTCSINAPGLINDTFSQEQKKAPVPILYFNIDTKKYIMEGGSRNRLDNVFGILSRSG